MKRKQTKTTNLPCNCDYYCCCCYRCRCRSGCCCCSCCYPFNMVRFQSECITVIHTIQLLFISALCIHTLHSNIQPLRQTTLYLNTLSIRRIPLQQPQFPSFNFSGITSCRFCERLFPFSQLNIFHSENVAHALTLNSHFVHTFDI